MVSQSCCRLVAAFVLLLGTNSILRADTGWRDLWQVTSKMSMEGMPMKCLRTCRRFCAAKVWTQPPGGNDQQVQADGFSDAGQHGDVDRNIAKIRQ
jgi:hypothetical protein